MAGSIVGIYLSASMSVEVSALTVISHFQFCIMYIVMLYEFASERS